MARLELILTRYHFNVFELIFLTRTPTVVTRTTPLKRDRRPPLSRSSTQEVAQRSKRERTHSRTSERRSLKTNGSVSRDAQTSTTYETYEPQHSVSLPRVLECINSPLQRRGERLGVASRDSPPARRRERSRSVLTPEIIHRAPHHARPPATLAAILLSRVVLARPSRADPTNAVQSPGPPSPRPSPLVSRRVSTRTRRTHRVKERRSRARARTMSGGVCGRDDDRATAREAIVGRRGTS